MSPVRPKQRIAGVVRPPGRTMAVTVTRGRPNGGTGTGDAWRCNSMNQLSRRPFGPGQRRQAPGYQFDQGEM